MIKCLPWCPRLNIILRERWISEGDGSLSIPVSAAFRRHGGEPRAIRAVIVDGILATNPCKTSVLEGIEVLEGTLIPPPLPLCGADGSGGRGFAAVDMEAAVGGEEGRLAPVGLLKAASRGPVVGIPEAGVDLHGLIEWVAYSLGLTVLEDSDWHIIYEETDGGGVLLERETDELPSYMYVYLCIL